MNIPHGVTNETVEKLEFEAGLILTERFAGGALDKSKVLCATDGGIRVNIAAVTRNITFDGVRENTAGLKYVQGYTGSVQFSTKEVDAENVKMAIGYADISGSNVVLKQGLIPNTTAYYTSELCILGKMGDGSWRQIVLSNAINVNGLQETRNANGEVTIAFDLQANYSIEDQDTPPISIEYITAG